MARRPPGGVPDWQLERYLLDELPPHQARQVAELERGSAEVRSRLATLRASNSELEARYPAAWMGRRIQRRLDGAGVASDGSPGQASGWRPWLAPRLAAPAAVIALVAVVLVSLPDTPLPGGPPPAGEQRRKGAGPHLILHRKTPAGSQRLSDGAGARTGDRILIQYRGDGAAYGAIVSVDGRGTVTRHLPQRGDASVRLERGGPVSLEYSYELDDAPRLERFYLVTAAAPFAVETVLRAAAGAPDALHLPARLAQSTFTLVKPAAP